MTYVIEIPRGNDPQRTDWKFWFVCPTCGPNEYVPHEEQMGTPKPCCLEAWAAGEMVDRWESLLPPWKPVEDSGQA